MNQVDTLEGIRTFVNDGSGNALDLLKDERHVRSTLGIRMLPHGSPHRRANINPREVRLTKLAEHCPQAWVLLSYSKVTRLEHLCVQVHGVTPGGPAALSRKIKIGDEVVAVDGVELDPGRAIEQVAEETQDQILAMVSLIVVGPLVFVGRSVEMTPSAPVSFSLSRGDPRSSTWSW